MVQGVKNYLIFSITNIIANITKAKPNDINNGEKTANQDHVATIPVLVSFNIKNIKNIIVLKLNPLEFDLLFFICYTIHTRVRGVKLFL